MAERVRYPGAIRPTLALYGRVLKAHWPMLLALTVAYPLVSWGASLAWKALPVATGWVEIALNGAQLLVWAMAWGLMGAAVTQLTLAVSDRRPADAAALLRACASALPVVALFVLATDVTSLPLSLWRSHVVASGQLAAKADAIGWLTLPFAILDMVVLWLFIMAVPVRLDRELSPIETLKASAGLARRRWRTMLLVLVFIGGGLAVLGMVIAVAAMTQIKPTGEMSTDLRADSYLWKIPVQVLSMAWLLFWPALYVTFRDQEETGGVAEAFD